MANVIIKSEDRKRDEQYVMRSFGAISGDPASKEAAECIAARSREAYYKLKRMEEKYHD